MWARLGFQDGAVAALLLTVLLSFVFWPLALWLGFGTAPENAPEGYQTYFEQINWWPFPFFLLALAPGLWLTWRPLLRAWVRLAETGVLRGPEGPPEKPELRLVQNAIHRRRYWALLAAFAVAVLVNGADWAPRFGLYSGVAGIDRQLRAACHKPNAMMKWIFEARRDGSERICSLAGPRSSAPDVSEDGVPPPPRQVLFLAVLALQQFLIVFFASLCIMQLLLHCLLFAVFERLEAARAWSLRLVLNCRSPLNEFGLEHWNHALNNFYWAVSPALLGVFLSRASTPEASYAPGQVLLGFAVPACLILPMVATILVRQARLPAAWKTLEPEGPVPAADYRRQQLWPLDRNWSSKLGILLAFALAALSIGFEISQLVRL